MTNIGDFTLKDMAEFSAALRSMGSGAVSMEETAEKIVHYLYDNLSVSEGGEKGCILVRFFKTHTYNEIDSELQDFAQGILKGPPESPDMKCLVLLATVGTEKEWNSRRNSRGHKAIPLPSVEFIEGLPMVNQLIRQIGLDTKHIVRPDPAVVLDMAKTTYSIFCIPEAVGSSFIPDQDEFVIPYGVSSAIGFGGILPSGNFFTIIIFSKIPVSMQTAEMFSPLALSVKIAILPYDGKRIFK